MILESLTLSAINALGGDGDHPHFLPQLGELMNVGQPNADTIYRMAHITPGGSYRLRGKQGSITMSIIGQVGGAPSDPEGNSDHPGPTRNYLDINSLEDLVKIHFFTPHSFVYIFCVEPVSTANGHNRQTHGNPIVQRHSTDTAVLCCFCFV